MHPLDKQLMHRINRLAHADALEYEKHTRDLLTARLLKDREAGASHAELEAALDALEAAQMGEGMGESVSSP